MNLPSAHDNEPHYITRSGWLRAAVLGANDGIVSISSLLVDVASADPSPRAVLIAGVAGLTAGRCRWPLASTFRCPHNLISSAPTLSERNEH